MRPLPIEVAIKAIERMVAEAEKLFVKAVATGNYAEAASRRSYINGLQVALATCRAAQNRGKEV